MKKTTPWPRDATTVCAGEPITIPVGATTVELSPQEVLDAVTMYVGTKLGVAYKGYASLNIRMVEGQGRRGAAVVLEAELMTTTWNEKQLENANRFTARIGEALTEAEVAQEDGYGYVLGWLYGQFRQRLSKEQVRQVFEASIAKCEEQLEDVAEA